jgi:hypothetical protein
MRVWTKAAIIAAAMLSVGSTALAQSDRGWGPPGGQGHWGPGGRPPGPPPRGRIVLYSRPYFGGRSVVLTGPTPNFNDVGFNDRARSAKVQGRWLLCQDGGFRGQCRAFDSDTPTLFGLNGKVSSARPDGWR